MSNASPLPIAAAAAPAVDVSQALAKQEDIVRVAPPPRFPARRFFRRCRFRLSRMGSASSPGRPRPRHHRALREFFPPRSPSKPKISSLPPASATSSSKPSELENPLYVANNADRCYHCKDELFDQMDSLARSRQFAAIAYGINADDTRDFRPGHRAAHEHHVLAPLLDAALHKSEIRFLSQRAGLSTWNRPASACLSSRVPYGTAVTPELLDKIDRAEAVLRELDFRQFRVRAHGELARIEIALDELPRGLDPAISQKISEGVKVSRLLVRHIRPGRLPSGFAQFRP